MRALADLFLSAVAAALAWAIYEASGHAAWALLFLVLYVAAYLWVLGRRRSNDS